MLQLSSFHKSHQTYWHETKPPYCAHRVHELGIPQVHIGNWFSPQGSALLCWVLETRGDSEVPQSWIGASCQPCTGSLTRGLMTGREEHAWTACLGPDTSTPPESFTSHHHGSLEGLHRLSNRALLQRTSSFNVFITQDKKVIQYHHFPWTLRSAG